MAQDPVPHAGVLRAANAAADLARAMGEAGFPLTVKAAGESDDGHWWATFRLANGSVTSCRVDREEADKTVAHLAAWVRS